MKDNILYWAGLVAESQEEPSYNDVLMIKKYFPDKENVMSPEEYDKQTDEEKLQIHNILKTVRQMGIDSDEPIKTDKQYDASAQAQAAITDPGKDDKHCFMNIIEVNMRHLLYAVVDRHNSDSEYRTVKTFKNVEDAKKFFQERVKKNYNLELKDFKMYNTDYDRFPSNISKVDKNAVMFQYKVFEGEEDHSDTSHENRSRQGTTVYYKHDGQVKTAKQWVKDLGLIKDKGKNPENAAYQLFKKKIADGRLTGFELVSSPDGDSDKGNSKEDGNLPPDTKYKNIKKDVSITYIIYTAKESVPIHNWIDDLGLAIQLSNMSPEEKAKYYATKKKNDEKAKAMKKADAEFNKTMKDVGKALDDYERKQREQNPSDVSDQEDPFDLAGDGDVGKVDDMSDDTDGSDDTGDEESSMSNSDIEGVAKKDKTAKDYDDDEDKEDDEDDDGSGERKSSGKDTYGYSNDDDTTGSETDTTDDEYGMSTDKDREFDTSYDDYDDDDEDGGRDGKKSSGNGSDPSLTPEMKAKIKEYARQLRDGEIEFYEVPDEVKYDNFGDVRSQFKRYDNDTYSNMSR